MRRRSHLAEHPRQQERRQAHRRFRDRRHRLPDRPPHPARGACRGQVQPRRLDGRQGTAQGRSVHRVRDGGGEHGHRRCRRRAEDGRRRRAHRCLDRLGHRRGRHHLRGVGDAAREGATPCQPVLRARPHHQHGLGQRLDPLWAQGPQPFGGHGLLNRRACDRRQLAHHRHGRRRRDGGRRRRIPGQPAVDGGLCRLPGALDRLQ